MQPYLIVVGQIEQPSQIALVLGDSCSVGLPQNSSLLQGFDYLIKAHFVFNVHFHLAWKNAFRFVSTHVMKLPPENPRLSTFMEEFLLLEGQQV